MALPVALDAFGGDHAPGAVIRGAALAAREGIPVLLVGPAGRERVRLPRGIAWEDAPEVVTMNDPAHTPLRRKPGASIRRIHELVAEGHACAAVTCGNSGAAMASAMHVLGTVDGVDRPPLCTVVPRRDGGQLVLLDLGANVDCRPEHLAQFAVLGEGYARAVLGLARPRVGLVANGEEPGKGNTQSRAARPALEALDLHFVGNVEPLGALRGDCDVLVCDGFVGNIMLKTVQGTAEVVSRALRDELRAHPLSRLGAWLLGGAIRRSRARTAYDAVGGALLLGVGGVAVVGHGRADARAVASAVRFAHAAAHADLVPTLRALTGGRIPAVTARSAATPLASPPRQG